MRAHLGMHERTYLCIVTYRSSK